MTKEIFITAWYVATTILFAVVSWNIATPDTWHFLSGETIDMIMYPIGISVGTMIGVGWAEYFKKKRNGK